MKHSSLSTHVLDLMTGMPAKGLAVSLFDAEGNEIGSGVTDSDGRITQWVPEFELASGEYRLRFATKDWFDANQQETFYPSVSVDFIIDEVRHYHVPLLLNSYGYSTYRGS